MEQKGCESIECWNHYVTLSYDIFKVKFWKSRIPGFLLEDRLTRNERDVKR